MVKQAVGDKKATKGKQRIPIQYIGDKEKRQVTFSKRKGGLLKKASELHLLCGAHVAVVIFSQKQQQQEEDADHPNSSGDVGAAAAAAARPGGRRSATTTRRRGGGNVFAMGTPSVDHVMSRIAGGADPDGRHRAAQQEEEDARAAEVGREGEQATARRRDDAKERVDTEEKRMKAVAAKVHEATPEGRFWWEADVEALGEADLPEFGGALKRLRDNVLRRHADKLVAQ